MLKEQSNDEHVSAILKKMYNESEHIIKLSAKINRAYTDKISMEMINQKVNYQMNSINIGINEINPKFKEGSKNYDIIKQKIIDCMTKYEASLIELSDFYDGKIEQLILRKVELEASLVGMIFNEEYLYRKKIKKIDQKENDKVKYSISNGIKKVIEKLKNKNKEKQEPDIKLMHTLQDEKDIEMELTKKLEDRVEKTKLEQKDNKVSMEKVKKEIKLIDDEIKRINDRKKQALNNAMEVGEKYITTNIKKPKVFKKITRFFIGRFNTPKVVCNTIIEPLNERIENFNSNELANITG